MTPTWCVEFVGMPYREGGYRRNNDGYDCWGLIRAVYGHVYGIEVLEWDIEVSRGCWAHLGQLERPQEGDLLLFSPDGMNHHVGLVADPGRMLHAAESLGQVIIEPYTSGLWKTQHKRTYRHDLR